jgi:hypothetical protein
MGTAEVLTAEWSSLYLLTSTKIIKLSWCLPCNATLPYRTQAPENEDLVCVVQNKVMLSEEKNIRSFGSRPLQTDVTFPLKKLMLHS